jgi:hypothetical protein
MSIAAFEIPLSGESQSFGVTLAGAQYQLLVQWRNAVQTWFLDIADASGNPLVQGIALVTGVDLLGQHKHLGIDGSLFVVSDDDPGAMPTYDNMGTGSHLYFVVSS